MLIIGISLLLSIIIDEVFIFYIALLPIVLILIFSQIAYIVIIEEDNFKSSIRIVITKCGTLVVDLFGTSVLLRGPLKLIEYAQNKIFLSETAIYSYFASGYNNLSTGLIVLSIFVIVLYYSISVFADAFIFTYLTKKYLSIKNSIDSAYITNGLGFVYEEALKDPEFN